MTTEEGTGKAERVDLSPGLEKELAIYIYPDSINSSHGTKLFLARQAGEKFLFAISEKKDESASKEFEGEFIMIPGSKRVKKCLLTRQNSLALQRIFPFTRPTIIGLRNSYGFGDRLGLANAGHLRALKGYDFVPVLAQQSIRELARTQRTPEEVINAAVWAAFQEGYKSGFGADADHLKTTGDVDRLVKAGFTMFTIDPSDYIVKGVTDLSQNELSKRFAALPWNEFGDTEEISLRDTRRGR